MVGLIANLEDGASVRGKLNDLIDIANANLISPAEFGAVGDGTADDTDAVNEAFALSKSSGRGVILPAGKTYRVTSHLEVFTNGMVVVGGGTLKAANGIDCLRHFPTGWASGTVTERTISGLSLTPNWQGRSGHNVTVINTTNTTGLQVGQWLKIGSSTITIPGAEQNFWFEWAQIRAIAAGSNVTLDRVLEGHARGILPGVHANYRFFPFPANIGPVIVDVGFEADESAATVYTTTLTGRSGFLIDRGSVNARIRVRGRRWWTTLLRTHGILSVIEASWEELPDLLGVLPTANQATGYGVDCAAGAYGVTATITGGTCRHGFTTTSPTLASYDATRPFDLGLSFYCGTTPTSRISGSSAAAYDTHVQSFGARLFGESIGGVQQGANSNSASIGCQDRGFNTTIGVRVTSAQYRGFQLAAAQTNWGALGQCVTILDDMECRDVNGGSHVVILGTSTVTNVSTVLRSPLFIGSAAGTPVGIVISSGYAGKLIVEDAIYASFNSNLIRDESGLASIEIRGGHADYKVSTPPTPFIVGSTAVNKGDGTTSQWTLDGMLIWQVSGVQPDGLFRNDAALNINVQLGRVVSQTGALPIRAASSTGAQVLLKALFDTGDSVPFANATGSMAGAASGRSWKLTGNVTAVPISDGWKAVFANGSGTTRSVTPASGTCIVTESGLTAGSVSVANNKMVHVFGDGTNLWVFGDVV